MPAGTREVTCLRVRERRRACGYERGDVPVYERGDVPAGTREETCLRVLERRRA